MTERQAEQRAEEQADRRAGRRARDRGCRMAGMQATCMTQHSPILGSLSFTPLPEPLHQPQTNPDARPWILPYRGPASQIHKPDKVIPGQK